MQMLELGSGVLTDGPSRGLDGTIRAYNLIISISDYEYQHRIFFLSIDFFSQLSRPTAHPRPRF